MTVTRHWIAYDTTRPDAAHRVLRSEAAATQHRVIGYTVEGPFVHADQLQGAVEALRQIRRTALSTAGGDRERYREKVAEIIEITGHVLGGRADAP